MQRWIILGVVMFGLLCGGGAFAVHAYRQSRPVPMWVPLPMNPEVPVSKRIEIVDALKTKITENERLLKISKDTGLVSKWKLASEEEGAAQITKRLFIKEGDMEVPQKGRVPAIHIGIKGTRKESEVTKELVDRVMKEVFDILELHSHTEDKK